MRSLIVIIFLLIVTPYVVSGQTASNTESRDSTNIYYQAFNAYCAHLPTCNLLLEEDNITTESIPHRIGIHNIEVLDFDGIQKKLKKSKSIVVIRIIPLRINDGKFFINIIPFDVKRTSSGLDYINSGGSKVELFI